MPVPSRKLYFGLLAAGLQTTLFSSAAAAAEYQMANLHTNPSALLLRADTNDTLLQIDGYFFVDDSDELIQGIKKAYDEGRALQGRSRGVLVIPGDEAELVRQQRLGWRSLHVKH